jgi:XrtJ-associated TM-motif-TM protein
LPLNGLTAMLTVSLLAMLPGIAAALPNGCVDSPENPSVILGLAGGTVVGLSYMWTRWRSK